MCKTMSYRIDDIKNFYTLLEIMACISLMFAEECLLCKLSKPEISFTVIVVSCRYLWAKAFTVLMIQSEGVVLEIILMTAEKY